MPAPQLPIRAFQWDLARQVERLDWLLAQLPRYADWGYQELYLHLEDAVRYPSLPGVARSDAYTYRELERLVTAASRVKIGVVPIVNLLGHTQYLVKVPALRDLNELRAPDGSPLPQGQICPLHPRTLEVAEKLLRDMRPFCTTGKVHVGLDESFHLGKHPLSRAEIARIGLPAHFAGYVRRLHNLNQALGLRTGIWADMLYFLPEAIPLLPAGLIAYDWYYYPFKRHPRVEFYNFAERDLATPLRRQGIEYWGCPMNGAFRHEPLPLFGDRLENIRSWWERCRRVKAAGFLVTSWEANRLALETTTVVDAAAASLWLEPERCEVRSMLSQGISRTFNRKASGALAAAALRADRYAFVGYARWEINRQWDRASGEASVTAYRQAQRHFKQLVATAEIKRWPEAFRLSWRLRHYLAERDVFVHESRAAVYRLRRIAKDGNKANMDKMLSGLLAQARWFQVRIAAGQRAAQGMWRRTRRTDWSSPYSALFAADRTQLVAWQRWLRQGRRKPKTLGDANPMCGCWQLAYQVLNHAPAVQLVRVEQEHKGQWLTIKACHTIEFQAEDAQRHGRRIRHHSTPLTNFEGPDTLIRLRFVAQGAGEVKIGSVHLTDGITRINLTPRQPGWIRLGAPAPKNGLPDLGRSHHHDLPMFALPQ
jgi:hypothetical protein